MAGSAMVSFKVSLITPENPLNVPEVRRFDLPASESASVAALKKRLRQIFPQLVSSAFTVSWQDGDGDDVIVRRDEELEIALADMADRRPYRFFVRLEDKKETEEEKEEEEEVDWATSFGQRINKLQEKRKNSKEKTLVQEADPVEQEDAVPGPKVKEMGRRLEAAVREAVSVHGEAVQEAVRKTTEEAGRLTTTKNPMEVVGNVAEAVASAIEPLVIALRKLAEENKAMAASRKEAETAVKTEHEDSELPKKADANIQLDEQHQAVGSDGENRLRRTGKESGEWTLLGQQEAGEAAASGGLLVQEAAEGDPSMSPSPSSDPQLQGQATGGALEASNPRQIQVKILSRTFKKFRHLFENFKNTKRVKIIQLFLM
jgi:hypothetical protein